MAKVKKSIGCDRWLYSGHHALHVCPCPWVISSPWVWVGYTDLLLMNRIWQKWWDLDAKRLLFQFWGASLTCSRGNQLPCCEHLMKPMWQGTPLCTLFGGNWDRHYQALLGFLLRIKLLLSFLQAFRLQPSSSTKSIPLTSLCFSFQNFLVILGDFHERAMANVVFSVLLSRYYLRF